MENANYLAVNSPDVNDVVHIEIHRNVLIIVIVFVKALVCKVCSVVTIVIPPVEIVNFVGVGNFS